MRSNKFGSEQWWRVRVASRRGQLAGWQVHENDAANFDRLAGVYRWMEWLSFGPSWHAAGRIFRRNEAGAAGARSRRRGRALYSSAASVKQCRTGGRGGRKRGHAARALRSAGRDAQRVRTYMADARRWTEREPYDMVATHFFLDCLTTDEVRELAARVRPALAQDAVWVVSEFAVPQGAYGRLVARPLIAFLYIAFGVMTGLRVRRLPDHGGAMEQAGFTLRERRIWLGGLLMAEIWTSRSD